MRLIRKISKWLGLSAVLLMLIGAVYNQVGLIADARFAPPRNEMVDVDGRMIHVACTGGGRATIILDAGLGAWSFEWFRLQPLLAQWARVCSFDRAGMGWSESLGGGHDGAAAAEQLHAIVDAAGISRPFIYVGHSLGANFAQIYFAKYPADIAGLVLMEPGNPKDLLEDFSGTRTDAMNVPDCDTLCYVAGGLVHVGVVRLAVAMSGAGDKSLPSAVKAQYRAGLTRASSVIAIASNLSALPKTAYQNIDVKSFAATPVLLFASAQARKPEGTETVDDVRVWQAGYRAYLASLAAQSSAGLGPYEVPHSTHATMVMGEEQAIWVAGKIAEFVPGGKDVAPTAPEN